MIDRHSTNKYYRQYFFFFFFQNSEKLETIRTPWLVWKRSCRFKSKTGFNFLPKEMQFLFLLSKSYLTYFDVIFFPFVLSSCSSLWIEDKKNWYCSTQKCFQDGYSSPSAVVQVFHAPILLMGSAWHVDPYFLSCIPVHLLQWKVPIYCR